MKVTLRASGERMFSVNVRFNVGRNLLVSILADKIIESRSSISHISRPKTSRTELVKLAKLGFIAYGLRGVYSTGEDIGISIEEYAAAEAEARKIIDMAFPELLPQLSRPLRRSLKSLHGVLR